ncbi:RhoGAP and/or C1 1 domain containing protein, partial [Asbolus verrucosus]
MDRRTPFKRPLPNFTPRSQDASEKLHSDSEESVSSNSDSNTRSASEETSLVSDFDDILRIYRKIRADKIKSEGAFIDFVEQTKSLYLTYCRTIEECKKLQDLLEKKTHDCNDLEYKLKKARGLIDTEKANTRKAEKERDDFAAQINSVCDILLKDNAASSQLFEELRHKLSFLQHSSILTDFSYSRSEEELDGSILQTGKAWQKHRLSSGGVSEPAVKKRRSSRSRVVEIGATETVRATTNFVVATDGPVTATSVIEKVPESAVSNVESCPNMPPSNLVLESRARESPFKRQNELNMRQHCFQQKTIVMPDTCGPCEKRIRFGKSAMKCKECKALCHIECKDKLPLPCVPIVNTPTHHTASGSIGDYTPTIPPMVPSLLIHCINEIELRGPNEVGLYRIPGAERDVKALKEKFLKGKGAPCLGKIDVHVICGTVKDFLRGLSESLLTYGLWKNFTEAVKAKNPTDVLPAIYHAISQLPQPNRDTLAYMILHLQKVSEYKECKMDVNNLARVFGPTIVGYSSEDPSPDELLYEVMVHLINIPSDYWLLYINVDNTLPASRLQQTPSTDSLLHQTVPRGLFTTPN